MVSEVQFNIPDSMEGIPRPVLRPGGRGIGRKKDRKEEADLSHDSPREGESVRDDKGKTGGMTALEKTRSGQPSIRIGGRIA
jgi:hypothetical protein